MTREDCLKRARCYVTSGEFQGDLTQLVARRSISQSEGQTEDLKAYLHHDVGSLLGSLGFKTMFFQNPVPNGPPILIASRIENPDLPKVLIYGHGDVCNGEAQRWGEGLQPFEVKREGDKLYGRGTADNKAQHLINIKCLAFLLEANGQLGFNVTFVIEMGEEIGSPGLHQFLSEHRDSLAADVMISSDGPRLQAEVPTVFMGSRGCMEIDFNVRLRDGDLHSGNFGGLVADPAILLSHAIASITDTRGQILIPEWRPNSLTSDLKNILSRLPYRRNEANWGEASLTPSERVFGWNSFAVLALSSGSIDAPQSVISASARATCQLRFVVGTNIDDIIPALRRHLDRNGFGNVEISQNGEAFQATRFSLDHPWVKFVCDSVERSTGQMPHILPNLAGSLPNYVFIEALNVPTIWIPHSHADCGQHGPNEHVLLSICEQAMQIMTDLFLDIGEQARAIKA
jgi:acetylornithine deacetylase/succinyl-diaminopimelate desuccinylase-like protein